LGPLKHFRLMSVRLTLAATGLCAILAYQISYAASMGLLLGGISATAAFWYMALRVEKLASMDPNALKFAAYRWTLIRLVIYGLALYKAYTLDTERLHGLIAAVGGLMLLRVVLVFVAFTGLDLRQQEK
jgi:hypothetical protein